MKNVALFRAVLALALLGLATSGMAQTATGQITGTVKDATGAVVPGATVTVTSELTGSKREVTTGRDGNYVIPLLPVSTYSVSASLTGFKAAKRTGVRLSVDQTVRIDVDLQTGDLSEAVEVQAGALALDSETATVGQVITEKQITDLPLNGRNFLSLLFLGAGAVEAEGEQGSMRQGAGNAISIMGSRPTSNNFMIDGTSNVDTALGTPAAILSIDALEEFKEQTKTYSAEYGFSANQINLVSKSGTNEFHGTLFGFMRDDSLDAKNFFDPPDKEKPLLDQKQFGGVVTGPIIKNKTFFLVNYEGTRIERGFSSFFRVPNPNELAGRFSTTIIDPTTGQPFPNNTIPSSRFSRLAQVALDQDWYPAPNSDSPLGNYSVVRTPSPDPEPVHGPDRPGPGPLRPGLRPLHGHEVREPTDLGKHPGHLGPDLHPERQELAGLPHLAHPQQPGELVPLRPRLGRRSSQAHRVPPVRHRHPGQYGALPGHPRRPAELPERRHSGLLRHRRPGQRLLREHPAHVGHQQHHHLDQGQPHLQHRRQLPPVVAAAGSRHGLHGELRLRRRVHPHRQPGRGLPSRLLHERLLLPARGLQRPGTGRQPA